MQAERPSLESLVPQLRRGLNFSKRRSAGEDNYLLEDPVNGQFYTLGRQEYQLLSFVDGRRSLRQIYQRYNPVDENPSGTPAEANSQLLTWEQACKLFEFLSAEKLLATINGAELSDIEPPTDSRWLQNVNPIGIRIRLLAGDQISATLAHRFGFLLRPAAGLVWIFMMLWAGFLLLGSYSQLLSDARTIIQPENLILLTVCWLVLKLIHESAHAICCKSFGGKVGDVGINFLLFLPMPYCDVTSSWSFDSKWKRIAVALAGIYAELIVAAIFVVIWTYTGNPVLKLLAVQVIFMASLTTLLFNINPLMKFDGYFVLSDLLDRPNLATNGERYRRSWLKQVLFGIQARENLATFDRVTKVYGWLASIWRIVVAVGLMIAAATLFYGAGIVLAALAAFIWYMRPLALFLIGLWRTPEQLSMSRCILTGCTLGVLIALSLWVPWPFAPAAPGVVEFAEEQFIRAHSSGFLTELHVKDGQWVKQGDLLAEFENPELKFQYDSLRIDREISILEARKLKRERKLAEYQAEQKKVRNLTEQIEVIKQQTGKLALLAPSDGFVVANDLGNQVGAFYEKGDSILKLVPSFAVQVVSCVEEFNAPLFGAAAEQKVVVEFESGASTTTTLRAMEPTAILDVIHPALSAEAGGPLAVHKDQEQGTKLVEPVFKVRTASFASSQNGKMTLYPGQRCRLFLVGPSHNCWTAIHYKLANWLKRNWEASSAAH